MAVSELRPNLKLVPTKRVRFHEEPEGRRTSGLKSRIQRDRQLRNPPIVAAMEDGNYLLLDGANRVSAFLELGFELIPVQVADYGDPSVQLRGWHHLLLDGRELDLREKYHALPGVDLRPVTHDQLARLLEFRQVYAVLVENEKELWGLFPASSQPEIDIHHRIGVLQKVVDAYEGLTRLERIKLADYEQLPEVTAGMEHQICLFPVLRKEELLRLAADGTLIPTGLSRHIIPGRALGINVDLDFITGEGSPEEKERQFQAFIDRLGMEGSIRFYEESVFIMNE
jgi:hypothetical protein